MESSVLTHKKEQQIKIEGEFKPTVDCLCAVSYTHLDVYKRQVHGTTQHNAYLPHAASGAEDDLVLCKLPGAQVPGSGKGIQLGF